VHEHEVFGPVATLLPYQESGGGEELGGLRGLAFYSQRIALQGARPMLDASSGEAVGTRAPGFGLPSRIAMTTAAYRERPAGPPTVRETNGIYEVEGEIRSPYTNHDLEPTRLSQRKWATKDIAALWISMSACVPTYMLASSLIAEGMSWWQAVLTIFLGNCVVLAPMVLNAHAGTKYGIPFPVYCRAAFGIVGANVPAVLRALVACGWFGIQAWIGGWAIYKILAIHYPAWEAMPAVFLGISLPQLACFLLFWGVNMWVIYKGIDSIRVLLNVKAPLLIVLGLLLLYWAYKNAGGFGPMLDKPSVFSAGQPKEGRFFSFFFPALTGMIGFWATLSLNIPDFTRYAYSQRDQVVGQALGLPTTMGLFSFIGVAVTSATVVIYGETIWDPVVLITRFQSPALLVVSLVALCIATLATNIAANVVSPANDFANLWPSKISFRAGGYLTGVIGILIQPWRLVSDPSGYIFTWLVGYSALLGAIGGILICDYYLVRRTRLDLLALYAGEGPYWYSGGWNPRAMVALAAGILPNLPGFLGTIKVAKVAEGWMELYHYAWFVGFGISFAVYGLLTMRGVAGGAPPR
jgi:NCS1 family nucleobase:cation symporter-1